MKLMKSMALMMMGAGAVLAYQKYKNPIMKKMDETLDKTDKKLENMMK